MGNDCIKELGDGLIMRHANPDDVDRLAAFTVLIHSNGIAQDSRGLDAWIRDLLSGKHPTFQAGDFVIIEDPASGKIISSMNLISQTWTYGGIPFGVGRPELVGTLPEYRRRGLVRMQFEEIHRWSQDRGERVQGITGIPFYYRQFGYEMVMSLGGGRSGSQANLPELAKDQPESYQIRPALAADIPFILETMAFGNRRYPVACQWTEPMLAFELNGKLESDINRNNLCIILDAADRSVGFFGYPVTLWGSTINATVYELISGVSWWQVTPAVFRYLWKIGQAYVQRDGGNCLGFGLGLGESHPAYNSFMHRLPAVRRSYAWYLRVPDLPGFLSLIGPVLEKRLEQSDCCGYSGHLKISFYCSGMDMVFDHGQLAAVETIPAAELKDTKAGFPGLTFLQLLFGHRSLADLQNAFADCYADADLASPLLEALFPRCPSALWPVS